MGVAKQMEINQTRYDEKLLITTEIIKKTEEITIYRYIKRIIDIVISIIGIILLIRKTKRKEIPFSPFLIIGFLFLWLR